MSHHSRSRSREETHHFRAARLEELIREELGSLFQSELTDQRLSGARIARVSLSPEGARATIWVVPPSGVDDLEAERALRGARGFLRARLCDALELRRTPELRFFGASDSAEKE